VKKPANDLARFYGDIEKEVNFYPVQSQVGPLAGTGFKPVPARGRVESLNLSRKAQI